MANDGSLRGAVTQAGFALESQKGITILLASLRASELSKAQKNEIRDLVFEYTNGGRDESTRITLEQKINSSGLQPIAQVEAETKSTNKPAAKPKAFGMSRPSPSFTPTTITKSPNTETQKDKVAPTPQSVPVKPAATPVESTKPVAPQSSQESAPEPEPETVAPPVSSPTPEVTSQPVQPEPVSAPETKPAPAVETSPEPAGSATTPSYDTDQNLARIKEIKSLVNEKIGNPVNLVDINNEVGREYMSAMLDAMKKLNTGSAAVSAMQRLEAAYAQVEATLKESSDVNQQPAAPAPAEPSPSSPEPAPAVTKEPAVKSESAPVKSPEVPKAQFEPIDSQSASVPVQDQAPTPATQPEPSVQQASPKMPEAPAKEADPVSVSTPVSPDPAPTPEAAPKPAEAPAEADAERWGPAADTLETASKVADVNADKDKSHPVSVGANPTELKTPADLPEASAIENSSVPGDPLFTKEVDEGLDQLLSEWPIFKKSGLFGTGPKGSKHPLFLKVSGLQIPLLLAGRFEGATQEIKQSITDYMNGWRYEQGIIYNQGETFEHYLRRVIRHIIDLQNKK